jgi:hypothetical protein
MILKVAEQIESGNKAFCFVYPISSLFLILMISGISPCQEINKDRPGLPLIDFDLPAADYNLCRDKCDKNPRCRAYTYVKPGVQGIHARCWLKNGVPAQVDNANCISGVKAPETKMIGMAATVFKQNTGTSPKVKTQEPIPASTHAGNIKPALTLMDGHFINSAIGTNPQAKIPESNTVSTIESGSAPEVRRTLDLKSVQSKQFKLLRGSGKSEAVSRESGSVRLQAGDVLAAQTGQDVVKTPTPEGNLRLRLPYRFYGVKSDGKNIDWETVVEVEGGGIYPVLNGSGFEGNLYIGVIDEKDPTLTQALPPQVYFQVTSDYGKIEPAASVKIKHTNQPFERLKLVALSPPDSIRLFIKPSYSNKSTETNLRIIRPVISLMASPERIHGLGLDVAKITITVEGIEGLFGKTVTLNSDKGGLTATRVSLDSTGTGSTEIRSIGDGLATITARFPGAAPASKTITFTMPWSFLFWAGIGGLIGAVIRLFNLKPEERGGKTNSVARIMIGILTGILVAAGAAVGLNLLNIGPIASAGQAVIWVVAVLGGFAGTIMLPVRQSS